MRLVTFSRGIELKNTTLILVYGTRVDRDLFVAVRAERLHGLILAFLRGQTGIKVLIQIAHVCLCLLPSIDQVLVAVVVLRLHPPPRTRGTELNA